MATDEKMVKRWNEKAAKLNGRTIRNCTYTADKEFGTVLAIELDDGTVLFPMKDDEGNGPGALHVGNMPDLTCLPVIGSR